MLKVRKLSDILIEKNFLSNMEVNSINQEVLRNNSKFEDIILEKGYINEVDLAKCIAEQNELEYIEENQINPNLSLIKDINTNSLIADKFLPYKLENNKLYVACLKPNDISCLNTLNRFFKGNMYVFKIVSHSTMNHILFKLKNNESLKEIVAGVKRELKQTSEQAQKNANEKSSILKLMEMIIETSIQKGGSDIHFEPEEENMVVRARIDGMLQGIFELDSEIFLPLVTRIKLSAELDIGEKRIPQDGRFSMKIKTSAIKSEEKEYDFRVSTLPLDGRGAESVVFRILDKSRTNIELDKLGFTPENTEKFRNATKAPYGLVFVTGPTGSGKSTTLYAGVNEIKDITKKIITVEDPVEYKISKIQQVQINKKAGLTFAIALRSILRQDPDIIMIGEARDKETLHIAIEAALTGHLVFTTLHTNDAPSAVLRLIDMGVEPVLLTEAVVAIQAQRLVRKVCKHCAKEVTLAPVMIDKIKHFLPKDIDPTTIKFKKGEGCNECNMSGYSGRTIISEVFEFTKEIESYINSIGDKLDQQELIKMAKQANGFQSMFEVGIIKAIEGVTTVEEIIRVAKI